MAIPVPGNRLRGSLGRDSVSDGREEREEKEKRREQEAKENPEDHLEREPADWTPERTDS